MENLVGGKTVNLKLVGLDGNAFSLMGAFQGQAKKEGWTKEEIMKVMDSCMDGDYSHLVATLSAHCVNGGGWIDGDDTDDGHGIDMDDDINDSENDPCTGCNSPDCNDCPHADEDAW